MAGASANNSDGKRQNGGAAITIRRVYAPDSRKQLEALAVLLRHDPPFEIDSSKEKNVEKF